MKIRIVSEKDRIPLSNVNVRINGETYESDIDGYVKPSEKFRIQKQVVIDAIRNGLAPEMVKVVIVETNDEQENEVSIEMKPFEGKDWREKSRCRKF